MDQIKLTTVLKLVELPMFFSEMRNVPSLKVINQISAGARHILPGSRSFQSPLLLDV